MMCAYFTKSLYIFRDKQMVVHICTYISYVYVHMYAFIYVSDVHTDKSLLDLGDSNQIWILMIFFWLDQQFFFWINKIQKRFSLRVSKWAESCVSVSCQFWMMRGCIDNFPFVVEHPEIVVGFPNRMVLVSEYIFRLIWCETGILFSYFLKVRASNLIRFRFCFHRNDS